jgi:hypothetical protein
MALKSVKVITTAMMRGTSTKKQAGLPALSLLALQEVLEAREVLSIVPKGGKETSNDW